MIVLCIWKSGKQKNNHMNFKKKKEDEDKNKINVYI